VCGITIKHKLVYVVRNSTVFYRVHYTSNWETYVTAGVLILEQGSFSKTSLILHYVAIIIQQDATVYSLCISVKCSTCFGLYFHPSSGTHNTVSAVSGINETVTATCRERDWTFTSSHVHNRQHVVL